MLVVYAIICNNIKREMVYMLTYMLCITVLITWVSHVMNGMHVKPYVGLVIRIGFHIL